MFSCEFFEIFKNTFFIEYLRWLLLIIFPDNACRFIYICSTIGFRNDAAAFFIFWALVQMVTQCSLSYGEETFCVYFDFLYIKEYGFTENYYIH